jgi:hypothetical protein
VLIFGAGGGQRKAETPRTSSYAHFWGWWWTQKGRNPENEQSCSFSGPETGCNPEDERSCSFRGWWWPERGVETPKTSGRARFGAGGGQRNVETPKTSGRARFQGWWWPERLQTPETSVTTRFQGWCTVRGGARDIS